MIILGQAQSERPAARERRQFTARELYAIAADCAAGIPPAGSEAADMVRDAERAGNFARALELRTEVKALADDARRMARAAEKRERRARHGKARSGQ